MSLQHLDIEAREIDRLLVFRNKRGHDSQTDQRTRHGGPTKPEAP